MLDVFSRRVVGWSIGEAMIAALVLLGPPPLKGDEQHDKDGTLPPTGPVPPGPRHQR